MSKEHAYNFNAMKIFFFCIFFCLLFSIGMQAQSPLPKTGNRYSLKDTSKPTSDSSRVAPTASSVDSQIVESIHLTGNTTPKEEKITEAEQPVVNQANTEVKQPSHSVDAQVVESVQTGVSTTT
jgi:hypothetical protein